MVKSLNHEEYTLKGRRVILDTAEVYSGVYETMLLRSSDGEEIYSMTASTAEEAEKQFQTIRAKYPPDNKLSEPKPLTGKYAKLRDDLRTAIQIGRDAEASDPEDGGTCNFDASAISLPRWNTAKVKQAAKEAGTGCFKWNWWGAVQFVFDPDTRGQGNARSRNAEAMTAALKSMGYDAFNYCQMD